MAAREFDLAALYVPAALSAMVTLFRLMRWLLALPLRILGHRYVRIGGVLAITAAFLAARPTDPAFYGVCGGFLALSILARPLGRWLTPKPRRRPPTLPTAPSRPAPAAAILPQATPPPPPPPLVPQGPKRPFPSPVMVAVSARLRAPDEHDIRAGLSPRLQQLLTANSVP